MATCIGEEGLDIGEVDLIVCYDTSNNPRALVQRMGRTGRKRDGRCVLLCNAGSCLYFVVLHKRLFFDTPPLAAEQRNLENSKTSHEAICNKIVKSQRTTFRLYERNPRLLPDCIVGAPRATPRSSARARRRQTERAAETLGG